MTNSREVITGNSNSEGHIVFRGFSQNVKIISSSNIAALLCAEQQSLSLHLSEVCQFVSMSELRQIINISLEYFTFSATFLITLTCQTVSENLQF